MNSIFVKSSKSFKHGFILDEQEIRRISMLLNEQIRKTGCASPYLKCYIAFKNGTFAEGDEIEYIFEQENVGSSKISYLGLLCQNTPVSGSEENNSNNSLFSIKLEYEDTIISDSSNNPIRYSIRGADKDWVMVSSSLVQERISKNKRNNVTIKNTVFFQILIMSVLFLALNIIFSLADKTTSKFYYQDYQPFLTKEDSLKAVEKRNKAIAGDSILNYFKQVSNDTSQKYSQEFKNYVYLQKMLFNKQYKHNYELRSYSSYEWKEEGSVIKDVIGNKLLLIGITLLFITLLFYLTITQNFFGLYPTYNFLIGENVKIFESIETKRKAILAILGGTILLGLIVNLASNYLWNILQ